MTESIINAIHLKVMIGCYGSFVVELPDLSQAAKESVYYRSVTLGSDGPNHGYPTFSDSHTPAEALRAFAAKLDYLYGPDPQLQRQALSDWQWGKIPTYQELLEYGRKDNRDNSDASTK